MRRPRAAKRRPRNRPDEPHSRSIGRRPSLVRRAGPRHPVLSFPGGGPEAPGAAALLGDIVLAYETVAREAAAEDKPIGTHVTHLVIHGFLHLVGFDHETVVDAEAMEAVESRTMLRLGCPDPYAGRPAADAS